MLLNRWILVIELLNVFSLTFASLELQILLLSKLHPRTLNDFFPFYLKNSDCIIFPLSEITRLYVSSASSSHPEHLRFFQALRNSAPSSILPAAMTENLTPGASLPVLTAKLKTSQKPPLKDLLNSAKQSGGNGHLVLERPAGAEA